MKDSMLTEMEEAYRQMAGEDNVRLLDEMERKVAEIQQHQAEEETWLISTIISCVVIALIPLFTVFGSFLWRRMKRQQEQASLRGVLAALLISLAGGVLLFFVNFSMFYAKHHYNLRGQVLVLALVILVLGLVLWLYKKRKR